MKDSLLFTNLKTLLPVPLKLCACITISYPEAHYLNKLFHAFRAIMFRDSGICIVCLNCQENPEKQNLLFFDAFGTLSAVGWVVCACYTCNLNGLPLRTLLFWNLSWVVVVFTCTPQLPPGWRCCWCPSCSWFLLPDHHSLAPLLKDPSTFVTHA